MLTARALAENAKVHKRSKRFGWLLGPQSKELRLEADSLVYAKGGKAGKALPFSLMRACEARPAKGDKVWAVVMADGPQTAYEFYADSEAARDMWVAAVQERIAQRKDATASRTQSLVQQAVAVDAAGGKAKRTSSFSRVMRRK